MADGVNYMADGVSRAMRLEVDSEARSHAATRERFWNYLEKICRVKAAVLHYDEFGGDPAAVLHHVREAVRDL